MCYSPQDNEYVQAIRSVASVLAPYDSDQLIPVFGFGARLPPDGHVSHCFPLNFNYERPEVYGVQVGGAVGGAVLGHTSLLTVSPIPI